VESSLDRATIVDIDLKNWEKQLEKLEEHCKPRGSKLVAATQYNVLLKHKEKWNYLNTLKSAGK